MNVELLAQNIAAHWVQSGLLFVGVLVAMRLLRVGEPRLRLAALHLTLAATLLLPFVQPWRPSALPMGVVALAPTTEVFVTKFFVATVDVPPSPRPDIREALLAVIAGGIVLRMLWLCGGIIRLRRFRARAREIPAPDAAHDLEATLGVAARYFDHREHASPATFGIFGATVLLPSTFASLDVSMQRSIVCHELVHVKRRDAAIAGIEEVVTTLLWFHPWVWVLRSRIRLAREQVVDRQVLELIGNREMYVRCLVELSGHDLIPHLSTGMSSSRELRTRIDALLEEVAMSRRRAVAAGFILLGVIAASASLAAWAVPLRVTSLTYVMSDSDSGTPIASLFSRSVVGFPPSPWLGRVPPKLAALERATADSRPPARAQQTPAAAPRRQITTPYAEYPQDAIEKRIAGTVVVDVAINPAGDVTTGAVVSGPQELRASAFKAALGLKFEPGSGMTSMRVSVEYRLTADSWGVRISTIDGRAEIRQAIEMLRRETPLAGNRVGGALQPPKKIKDVPPVYPDAAQKARVQGVVILEARIDELGNVSDTRVLRSIPLLDQAAVDAVKEWQYTPTLLNGAAVPVVMTMTVNFSLRDLFDLEVTLPDGSSRTSLYSGGLLVLGRYQCRVSRVRDSNDVTVSVYGEDGQVHLGDVVVQVAGPVVQLPTTPPAGLRLVAIR